MSITVDLKGKVALVTGGTAGIGREIARSLACSGADVVVNYHSNDKAAENTVSEIEALGVRAAAKKLDMGSGKEAISAMVAEVYQEFGRLDILVNGAAYGLQRPRPLVDQLPDFLHKAMEVTYFGALFATQTAAKLMGEGSTVFMLLSPGYDHYIRNYGAVGPSKAALKTAITYFAVELAPRGVSVFGINSGLVEDTEGFRVIGGKDPEGVAEYTKKIPAGRNVTSSDISKIVLAVASGSFAMSPGQIFDVDGGHGLLD